VAPSTRPTSRGLEAQSSAGACAAASLSPPLKPRRRSNFKLSKLHGASFNDADGTESSFVQAVLIGASLNRGVWVKADFSSAELVDAKLELSNFQLASFAGTNLVGSSLVNSSFRDAETRRAAPARRQAAPRC